MSEFYPYGPYRPGDVNPWGAPDYRSYVTTFDKSGWSFKGAGFGTTRRYKKKRRGVGRYKGFGGAIRPKKRRAISRAGFTRGMNGYVNF